jgi:hypothetical protein
MKLQYATGHPYRGAGVYRTPPIPTPKTAVSDRTVRRDPPPRMHAVSPLQAGSIRRPRQSTCEATRDAGTTSSTVADRVALHLAHVLLEWSSRSRTAGQAMSAEEWHARSQRSAERAERERNWERALFLSRGRC